MGIEERTSRIDTYRGYGIFAEPSRADADLFNLYISTPLQNRPGTQHPELRWGGAVSKSRLPTALKAIRLLIDTTWTFYQNSNKAAGYYPKTDNLPWWALPGDGIKAVHRTGGDYVRERGDTVSVWRAYAVNPIKSATVIAGHTADHLIIQKIREIGRYEVSDWPHWMPRNREEFETTIGRCKSWKNVERTIAYFLGVSLLDPAGEISISDDEVNKTIEITPIARVQ